MASEEEPRPPSVADLVRAAIGSNDLAVPPPTYEEVRRRSVVVPLLVLGVVLALGTAGFAVYLREPPPFHSNDPAVTFSKPTRSDSEQVAPIRDLLTAPGASGSVRVAHVTYRPHDGVEVPGLAVELRDRTFNGRLQAVLPLQYVPRREPLLGGREAATIQGEGSWSQVVATPGRLFFATGESAEETLAVLRAMLDDEGFDVPEPPARLAQGLIVQSPTPSRDDVTRDVIQ